MGLSSVISKLLGYTFYKKLPAKYSIIACAVFNVMTLGAAISFPESITAVNITSSLIRINFSFLGLFMLITFNPEIFGEKLPALTSSIILVGENIAVLIAIVLSETFSNLTVLIVCLILSVAQLLTTLMLKKWSLKKSQ